jgi:RNA polymerase sigma-70 factor (ECF subfamily)
MFFRKKHACTPDADLVMLVAKGDEDAFRELLDRNQGAVYRFARRFIGDAHEAGDIAQETFLRLYRTAGGYQPQASLRAYLLRIARNLCIDFMRKKRPELMERLPETISQETPLGRMERAQALNALMTAVDALPENQRAVILLRHDQGLRYQEIADAMGLTVSAVESLLVRARRTLRREVSLDVD